MRKRWRIILLTIPLAMLLSQAYGQRLALKESFLLSALRVPNIGVELSLAPQWTLDVCGAYNPFQASTTRKWKLWTVQPELRYWFCRDFAGTFVGFHAGAGQYNVGGIGASLDLGSLGSLNLESLKTHRVQGSFWDAGFSVGHHWILSPRWGVEATLGLGYGHYRYERFRCLSCGEQTDSGSGHYLGPTRAGVSLVYLLR
jgi:hypothetical protein